MSLILLILWRIWNAPRFRCGQRVHCDLCKKPFRCTVELENTPAQHTHKGWANDAGTDHLKGVHFNVDSTLN